MLSRSLQLTSSTLRQWAQQSVASTSKAQHLVAPMSIRSITCSAPHFAVKGKMAGKMAASNKKRNIVKKGGSSGPKSGSAKRKGGADSIASLSKTSEFYKDLPDLSDLPTYHSENIIKASVGQVMAWNERTLAAFKSFGLPQELEREITTQPRPRTIVRENILTVLDQMDTCAKENSSRKIVLTGVPGCGKSTLVAQSIAYALDEGWAVISLPQATNLVNSSAEYSYSASQLVYLQPNLTKTLLANMLQVNSSTFQNIQITETVELEKGVQIEAGTTLDKVAKQGNDERLNIGTRQQILDLVIKTLANQTDVPVLVAIDDFQVLFSTSLYRDPDYKPLESYELGLPRSLISLLGPNTLKRGLLLGALSSTRSEFPATLELYVALSERPNAKNLEAVSKPVNAYIKLHDQHLKHAREAQLEQLDVSEPLTRKEAAALFAQLKKERKLWTPANDEFFLSKYIESSGNARTFSRSLRVTLL